MNVVTKIELEYTNCNLCGGTNTKLIYRKPDTRYWLSPLEFNLVQCKNCGLAYVNPRPTFESINNFYPDWFYIHRDILHEKERYLKEIRLIEKFKNRGKILDIGCGGGGLIKLLKDKGWEVYGMDLYGKSGNNYDLDIRYGDLEKLSYPSNFFDVVTAWAVFEHLHNPMRYFLEVKRILKKDGIFICLVNNINSIWSRYGYGEDLPRHLYIFSERTLRAYANKVGLRLISIDYSNRIFKASSKNVFRIRFLKNRGLGWREIYSAINHLPFRYKYPTYFLTILGRIFIPQILESMLRISGIIIGIFAES